VKKAHCILALSVLSIVITSLFAAALASNGAGTIWTSDSPDPSAPAKQQFELGDTVYIHWKGFLLEEPITINHTSGSPDLEFHVIGSSDITSAVDFTPTVTGKYSVMVGFMPVCQFEMHHFFVIPEVLFGSLGAVGAASAAGLAYYRHKRR